MRMEGRRYLRGTGWTDDQVLPIVISAFWRSPGSWQASENRILFTSDRRVQVSQGGYAGGAGWGNVGD